MNPLVLLATPIGNLGDISARARESLEGADLLYAEDTRHTGRLLQHLGLRVPMRSCHDHNERHRVAEIVSALAEGQKVVLVSDAGTPGIADPGHPVVRGVVEAGHPVSMVPGPSAPIMAVVLSGFATDRFVFDGWLRADPGSCAPGSGATSPSSGPSWSWSRITGCSSHSPCLPNSFRSDGWPSAGNSPNCTRRSVAGLRPNSSPATATAR